MRGKIIAVSEVFLTQEQAIDYATCQVCFGCVEIRVFDSNIERVIPFDDTHRRL